MAAFLRSHFVQLERHEINLYLMLEGIHVRNVAREAKCQPTLT